jgi:hypothetical protein
MVIGKAQWECSIGQFDKEDISMDMLEAYSLELMTLVFFHADHAHDHVTCHSISGIILFVGTTPVISQGKCQGCIATSTYCVEFIAMRSVEDAISIRYMLRCLGLPVTKPNAMYGINFGVIQSAENIAIPCHYVCEAVAALSMLVDVVVTRTLPTTIWVVI